MTAPIDSSVFVVNNTCVVTANQVSAVHDAIQSLCVNFGIVCLIIGFVIGALSVRAYYLRREHGKD